MMKTHWLGRTAILITAVAIAGCGGGTHELGTSPDAAASSTAGTSGALSGVGGAGGDGSAVDAPLGGGTSKSGGVMSTGGSSSSSMLCCNMLACPGGYTLIGVVSGEARSSSSSVTCPAGAKCQTFTTSCGCNTVLCAEPADGGVAGGQGGNAGSSGTGGMSGSTCPTVPPCNWCNGEPIVNADGCVTNWRCANGAKACSTDPCSQNNPCAAGYTCRDNLCWPGDAGVGGSGGNSGSSCGMAPSCNWCGGQMLTDGNGCYTGFRCANGADPCRINPCSASAPCPSGTTCRDQLCWPGTGGSGGSGSGGVGGNGGTTKTGGTGGSSSCMGPPNCNWCGGENVRDGSGCITGYRCANGADPCKVTACNDSAPCAAGYTCSNQLCWPNDGGAGETLCGGKVCGANEACCGPAECGKCVNALSGQSCPTTCTTSACGPSGAPCKTGEVCLDLVYWNGATRTGTASCQPNPCGADPLSCACAKSLCNGSTSCTLADAASGAVTCSTR